MRTITYPFVRPSRAYPAFEEAVEYEQSKVYRRVLVTLGLLVWALGSTIKLIDARHQLAAQQVFINDCGQHFALSSSPVKSENPAP